MKNNYAEEAMRISAKLSNESSDSMLSDYGPPTPVVNYDPPTPITNSEEVFDSKTGIFVKREETEDHADQGKNFRIIFMLFIFSRYLLLMPKHLMVQNKFGCIQKILDVVKYF